MKTFFGTDGIRDHIGTNLFTLSSLPNLGYALAQWACEKYSHTPQILIVHDTRQSCAFVKACLKSGLLLTNVKLYDAGILTTPAALHIMRHNNNQFDCAIIISASHNPHWDNGIKVLDKNSGKLSAYDEERISYFMQKICSPSYTEFGCDYVYENAQHDYVSILQSIFANLSLKGLRIVLDCAHGAAFKVAPTLFRSLGATVIEIGTDPNGTNINAQCGAVHTNIVQQTVISQKADCGFAFDGDGDRVIAVSRTGSIKNGDDILALLLEHPVYQNQKTVVGTVMSNQGFEQFLTDHNKKLIRTAVGDKYITESLETQNLLLGGEQSGHIILRDLIPTGDGILTALRTLESIIINNNWDMTTFTKYPQILINIPVKERKDLSENGAQQYITTAQELLGSGRLLVRFSGTEPLLRVMIEATSLEKAESIGAFLSQNLKTVLGS